MGAIVAMTPSTTIGAASAAWGGGADFVYNLAFARFSITRF
ncbi:hypothetical protein [Paraburkholderia acidipaludis]|nr:hypothetical protein [Paraburkholderia acidipaludis]